MTATPGAPPRYQSEPDIIPYEFTKIKYLSARPASALRADASPSTPHPSRPAAPASAARRPIWRGSASADPTATTLTPAARKVRRVVRVDPAGGHEGRLGQRPGGLSSDTSHGTDYYDGLLDITHGSNFVTVSWNRLHDHVKCSLVGHSDSNSGEDTGKLKVTYHHNVFSNCFQRNPRVRFGNPVHVFNNYYVNTANPSYSYGVATTCNAGVLVEGNYFEIMTDPTHVGEGSSPTGNLVQRNNVFVNSGTPQTAGSVAAIPYAYTADAASTVKSTVTAGAGTGKISG
ncbi:pectate lyase family protein [Micromonospora narathiwatensis]|uniref:Pectate lyase n=1 Tax=Micromonospora narathiwatensis TaxID=299146 RepID=A0A1A8ZJ23_9ACTN|nr:hypothetical protein [Micromonospora narathiwatensis]SBT44051.1 Pectate lyase [Micromonospora narathiwatensis]